MHDCLHGRKQRIPCSLRGLGIYKAQDILVNSRDVYTVANLLTHVFKIWMNANPVYLLIFSSPSSFSLVTTFLSLSFYKFLVSIVRKIKPLSSNRHRSVKTMKSERGTLQVVLCLLDWLALLLLRGGIRTVSLAGSEWGLLGGAVEPQQGLRGNASLETKYATFIYEICVTISTHLSRKFKQRKRMW
jgi:hypothetical protein